ncbi:hypothetical protein DY000_02034733 [Brassica cretica]|uniref:Uncharacterized protein n=1 Tax=Brassica cretica TaxID=69181 RepID=A0ABQ7DLW4_BRACR|nr:hypothetical protein DY000_02034733 [Brassica cretica]
MEKQKYLSLKSAKVCPYITLIQSFNPCSSYRGCLIDVLPFSDDQQPAFERVLSPHYRLPVYSCITLILRVLESMSKKEQMRETLLRTPLIDMPETAHNSLTHPSAS